MPKRQIVVVTHIPEIWLHNPNVYRVYKFGFLSYFYEDFVKDKDSLIFRHDPMQTNDYAYDKKHLIKIWCDLCGVPYDGSLPALYFTWREEEAMGKLTKSDQPLFFIETNRRRIRDDMPQFWATDMPISIAEEVIAVMNARGYKTIHIKEAGGVALRGTTPITFDFRQTLCALKYSKARLFVDSWGQHVAAALGMASVVTWVSGNPETVGYKMHKNIMLEFSDKSLADFAGSYKDGFGLSVDLLKLPASLDKSYSVEKITDAIENTSNK